MAEASKKKRRIIKKAETVRERAAKAAETTPKPRRIKRTASTAAKPVRLAGQGIKKAASPFAFLLRPFRTRPMRAIGRFLAKVLLLAYIRNSWREVRQVTWPSAKETAKLTLAVFAFAIAFALIIAVVDYGLDKVFKELLLK